MHLVLDYRFLGAKVSNFDAILKRCIRNLLSTEEMELLVKIIIIDSAN